MKKCIKFFLILGLVTFLTGVGTATAAIALGADWSGPYGRFERRLSIEHNVPGASQWGQDYQSFDITHISELEVELGSGYVYIEEDDTLQNEIRVTFSQSNSSFGYETEEGKLKLEYQKHRKSLWDHEFDYEENKMKILIPKDFKFRKVDLEVGAGVLWAGNLQADKIELEAGAGGIELKNASAGQLSMEAKAGGINYQGSVSGDISAECKAGGIEMTLDGEKTDFNYSIECKMGFVEIDGETYAGISGDSVYQNGGLKNMDLECKTGGIQIGFK